MLLHCISLYGTTVPDGFHTRLPSVTKSFPALTCSAPLSASARFNQDWGEERQIPKVSPDTVLYICLKSSLWECRLMNATLCRRDFCYRSLWLSRFRFLFSPLLSFIPVRRKAWVMKSSLFISVSSLSCSLSAPPTHTQTNLTYKFCMWQTRALLNSGQTASSESHLHMMLSPCRRPPSLQSTHLSLFHLGFLYNPDF